MSGHVLVATLGDADSFSSFVVGPGQMYHVESGAIYHIENVGDTRAELVLALRSERPQHFSLRASFSAMTDAVLGNTYGLPASAFAALDRSPGDQIVRREGPADIPSTAGLPNARLFDAEGQHAPLSYAWGEAKLARKQGAGTRADPHHIEDIGPDDINFLIFFDQPMPGDIGYRATASAFSREALAAGFGLRERDLPQFPFTPVDPLIVSRSNPVDPVA